MSGSRFKKRKARIAAGLGGKSVAVLRARFTTLVREAAKVIKAGKEGADRMAHEFKCADGRQVCQPLQRNDA